MEVLIRLFIILVFQFLAIHAEDSVLLNANIRMIPKLMALDTQILSKTKSDKVILAVVYEGKRNREAKEIAEQMNKYYNGKVANIAFNAVAVSADDFFSLRNIGCIFVTPMNFQITSKIAAWASANSIASFSYNVSDLDEGILGSISIERQTFIYISKKTLKQSNIRFNDILFQVARLVE
ncbi:MAG: hypothetical protein PHX59_06430 [Sulfuricurvum sp.]|nr:hypothetical protein [Sulfuricurvum sp.]